ncbi:M20 family metallopeptidase [Bacillus spongiae]|uniref:M20 family metallopeptidase n=2 Tax=Bacillus spongiae TaxID=2683610 RepID=A0ABU8HAX0_9BACI
MDTLMELLDKRYDQMIAIRRHLHQHPELSFQEFKTAAYIGDYYQNLGISVRRNVGGNGVVARIKGNKKGKTVALRADFDALPIQDQKDVPYKSTVPGVMHACGHDGHTATLLVLAKAIFELKEQLAGEYVFIHQHAEESSPGGAKAMIEDGCLNDVDVIFGTHLWSTVPVHSILYRSGPIMAAADRFELTIKGSGGHGAQPHKTKDSLLVAAQIVVLFQQIVSRRIDPLDSAVISVGSFIADNAFNVIGDQCKLTGTVRTFNRELQQLIQEEMEHIIRGICLASGCEYTFNYEIGYPAVINSTNQTDYIKEIANELLDVDSSVEITPQMGGEDFAYYLQHVPGCFFFTGAKPEGVEIAYPHHHPRFDINEKAMLVAAKVLGKAAVNYHFDYTHHEKHVNESNV